MLAGSTKIWRAIFLLYVAALPFASLPYLNSEQTRVQVADLIFVACLVTWILQERSAVFRWSRFHTCLAVYAAAVGASAAFSESFALSAVKSVGKFYLIGVAILAWHFVDSVGSLRKLVLVWLGATAVVAAAGSAGVAAFYPGFRDPEINLVLHPTFGSLPSGNYPRIEGFFEFPAQLCNYLGVSWMLALMAAAAGWIRWRTTAAVAVMLFAIDVFTLTPGLGGIFLTTGIFVFVWAWDRPLWLRAGVLTGGVVTATVSFASAAVALFRFADGGMTIPLLAGEVFPSHRFIAWRTAFDTFTQHPFFGRGVGMPVSSVVVTDPSGYVHLLADAHNTYFSALGETGMAGFAGLMAISVIAINAARSFQATSSSHKAIRLCLPLALADAFFFQSLTGSYEDTRHLWVLLGVGAAFGRTLGEGSAFAHETPLTATNQSSE